MKCSRKYDRGHKGLTGQDFDWRFYFSPIADDVMEVFPARVEVFRYLHFVPIIPPLS